MKIIYLITKSNYGGAQKYVYELARGAVGAGHPVVVACGGTGVAGATTGLLVEKLQSQNIRTILVRNFMRNVSLVRDLLACFEIYRILKKESPDVLHVSSSKAAGIGALAGRLAGVKRIIFTVHGLPEEETWRPTWQLRVISYLTKLTVQLADEIITITSHDTTILKNKTADDSKIHYIPNAIPTFSTLSKLEARKKLLPHLSTNTFIIGGVGELHPNKNWSLLLHVSASLPNQVHTVIIGTGEEEMMLKKLATKLDISERVHFLGYVEEAQKYISLFDIFILPSLKEGLPYALLEAGHASLPVVATELPGIADIIRTGEDGLLVKANSNSFMAATQMLIRDNGMRHRLARNLHETVLSRFTIERMLTETLSLYSGTSISTFDAEEEA